MPDFRWKLKYQSSYEAPTSTGGGEFTSNAKLLKVADGFELPSNADGQTALPGFEDMPEPVEPELRPAKKRGRPRKNK